MAALLQILGSALNPVSLVEQVKDENLKRRFELLGASFAQSQYITFLYSFGLALQNSFLFSWLSPVFLSLAASALKQFQDEDIAKVVNLSVPKALVTNTTLLDSIQYTSQEEKGTKKA